MKPWTSGVACERSTMDQVDAEGYGSFYLQCIFSFILLKENDKKLSRDMSS